MSNALKKVLKDCFTGVDNETYDLGRLLIAVSLFALFVLEALNLEPFDSLKFSGAVGTILGTGGILLKLKESSEPKCSAHGENKNDNDTRDNKGNTKKNTTS